MFFLIVDRFLGKCKVGSILHMNIPLIVVLLSGNSSDQFFFSDDLEAGN